jgi:hypothetical protein
MRQWVVALLACLVLSMAVVTLAQSDAEVRIICIIVAASFLWIGVSVSPFKQTLALFEHCTQVVEIEKEKARMQKEQDAKAVADAAAAKSRAGNDIHGSL